MKKTLLQFDKKWKRWDLAGFIVSPIGYPIFKLVIKIIESKINLNSSAGNLKRLILLKPQYVFCFIYIVVNILVSFGIYCARPYLASIRFGELICMNW